MTKTASKHDVRCFQCLGFFKSESMNLSQACPACTEDQEENREKYKGIDIYSDPFVIFD